MKLKELRISAGKTQAEIAKYLNMSQTGYNGYETGKAEPNLDVLKKLSTFYNKPIDYMVDNNLTYKIDQRNLSYTKKELFDRIENYNDETCKLIIEFLDILKIHKSIVLLEEENKKK